MVAVVLYASACGRVGYGAASDATIDLSRDGSSEASSLEASIFDGGSARDSSAFDASDDVTHDAFVGVDTGVDAGVGVDAEPGDAGADDAFVPSDAGRAFYCPTDGGRPEPTDGGAPREGFERGPSAPPRRTLNVSAPELPTAESSVSYFIGVRDTTSGAWKFGWQTRASGTPPGFMLSPLLYTDRAYEITMWASGGLPSTASDINCETGVVAVTNTRLVAEGPVSIAFTLEPFSLSAPCPAGIPPTADWDNDGCVTNADTPAFLADHSPALPSADINGNGSVSVQDLFDYNSLFGASGCVCRAP